MGATRESPMRTTMFYLNDPDGNIFRGEFVEVTSTSPELAQIGNYVVFRGLTADTMQLRIDDMPGVRSRRADTLRSRPFRSSAVRTRTAS